MPRRSGFVTGLAWTFVALGGLSTLIALLQVIMLAALLPMDEIRTAMRETDESQAMPALVRFMLDNFYLFFLAFLLVSAATFVSAIGLLKRWNWARLTFIGIMVLGVLWNLAGIAIPFVVSRWLPALPGGMPSDFRDQFNLVWTFMTAVTVVIGLLFAGLFAWIVKRLLSADVRSEFVP